jgi:predicted transcriptional regulator
VARYGMNIQALEVRQQIYEFIHRYPGLHFREIQRRLGIAVGTLQYHLRNLEQEKLIIGRKDGEYTRYYIVGIVTERDRFLLQFLRQRPVRHAFILLLEAKKANHKQISLKIGLSPATTSWYLSKLVDAGLVAKKKSGREVFYQLVEPKEISRVLLTYRASFLDEVVDRFVAIFEK